MRQSDTTAQLLQQGIAALQSGDKALARALLLQVVEQDDQNEQAWYWLSLAVDDPADKIVALENVLALNPQHEEAQNNLRWWRRRAQMIEADKSAAAEFRRATGSAPHESIPTEDQARQTDEVGEVPQAARAAAQPPSGAEGLTHATLDDDGAYDKYQCIYCGFLAAPTDRRCPDCRRKLMRRRPRRRGVSGLLNSARLVLSVLFLVSLFELLANALVGTLTGQGDVQTLGLLEHILGYTFFVGDLRALPAETLNALRVANVVRAGLLGLVAAGLYLRASFGYYMGMLVLVADLLFTAFRFANGYAGAGLLAVSTALALAGLYLIFASERDFAVAKERILAQPDSNAKGAHELSRRGIKYSKEGKWGLAVAHFQAAVNAMPEKPEFFKKLALSYMQIGRYQRALNALSEASRQAPDDAEAQELASMVKKKQAGDPRRGGEWWKEIK